MTTKWESNVATVAYMGKRYIIQWDDDEQRKEEVRRIKEDAHITALEQEQKGWEGK